MATEGAERWQAGKVSGRRLAGADAGQLAGVLARGASEGWQAMASDGMLATWKGTGEALR